MSWPDIEDMRLKDTIGTICRAAAVGAIILVAACTVRPLYMQGGDAGGVAADLASIEVAPVDTRYELEVRNHLIFLMTGGQGRTDKPDYVLQMDVVRSVSSAADLQSSDDLEDPTAKTITLDGQYSLYEIGTDEVVASGRRSATAAYDVPRQAFAEVRAERDAEDRAARELAEFIQLAVAQDLARLNPNRP